MQTFKKYTSEELINEMLKRDPAFAVKIVNANPNEQVNVQYVQSCAIPATYAKYILKEYLKNN